MSMLTQKPISTKPMNLMRSAPEPVGMVAAVSIKTIWNMKKAKIPAAPNVTPCKKKPDRPIRPHCSPNRRPVERLSPHAPNVTGEKAQVGELCPALMAVAG